MPNVPAIAPTLCALLLAACGLATPPPEPVASLPAFASAAIEIAADGRCFGRGVEPARVQTETAHQEAPSAEGDPARYRSVVRQQILRERREVRFETLCPPAYTIAFVASLQRALAARGAFRGAVTGRMDAATGRAVQALQRQDGPDSPLLALRTAQALGLVVLSREEIADLA